MKFDFRQLKKKLSFFSAIQLSKLKIRKLLKERDEIFLDIGSGDRKGIGKWLTVDLSPKCDILWDIRARLPFPDERIAYIYSSHLLEHLSYRNCQYFLDECKRVLVPGGIFSVVVPNAKLYIQAYLSGENLSAKNYIFYGPALNNTTKIDYVNYMAYMDGHHNYMFDEENLLFILKAKGFKDVKLRQFDPCMDNKERDFESIYAQAKK